MASNSDKINRRIGYPGLPFLFLAWTAIGSLAYARHYLQDGNGAAPGTILLEFLVWLTCFYPWVAFAPLVFRLERRYPLDTTWLKHLGWLALAGLPVVYAGAVVTQVQCLVLKNLFRSSIAVPTPWWRAPIREIAVQFVLYWTTIGAAYVFRNLIQLHHREGEAAKLALEKAQLETTLRQAELETLRARLNPHFLFNCLQNISVLIREDPQTAGRMLGHLGGLLRAALRRDGTAETTLASEIELTKAYVAVENVRFADRLQVLFDIAIESETALVPSLLLQPLVENAILHGLRGIEHTGVVAVRSAIDSDSLTITVSDNGSGLPVKNASEMELGIGLASTCERLQKMYAQRHTFSIRSLLERGTQVQVVLPLRFAAPRVGVIADEQTAAVGR